MGFCRRIIRRAFTNLRLNLAFGLCNDITIQLHFLAIRDLKLLLNGLCGRRKQSEARTP